MLGRKATALDRKAKGAALPKGRFFLPRRQRFGVFLFDQEV
jgi:hypothetical protein